MLHFYFLMIFYFLIAGSSTVVSNEAYGDLRNFCLDYIKNKSMRIWESLLASWGPNVIYMGPSTHRNLGDALLALGSVKMLRFFNKDITFCGDPQSNYFHPKVMYCDDNKIIEVVKDNGFIYYHPGGNWGDMYPGAHHQRMRTLQLASQKGINMISGPQTFFYTNNSVREQEDAVIVSQLQFPNKTVLSWRLSTISSYRTLNN